MAQRLDGEWLISPQDVIAEFECQHKLALLAAQWAGSITLESAPDPGLDLLREQGIAHEAQRLEALAMDQRVKRLGQPARSRAAYAAAWEATAEAMRGEYDAIYQATLFTGDFLGIADFLVLVRDENGEVVRDERGGAVYEPVDTKSARSAKRGAALQVGAYAEAMVRLGLPEPRRVHLWLAGDDHDWSGPADKFIALAREYRLRVSRRLPVLGAVPEPAWAPPREACTRCAWKSWCEEGRKGARDLSLVQGIHSIARQRLVSGGVSTIDALAKATDDQRPERVTRDTFAKLRAQADIQVRAEAEGEVLHEVTDAGVLAAVPGRSPGDLWFDMEGDPHYAGGDGLEYMFGFGFLLPDGTFDFDTTEASDPATERAAFQAFVDIVMQRRDADPGMHVYHYADYERRTLLRLAQKYGTREAEIDLLLREGRLVDLYAVVRTSLRLSTPSLSLKDVEKVYGVTHKGEDVSTAMDSVIKYEESIALRAMGEIARADEILAQIRSYNRLDCESTLQLDTWLRQVSATGLLPRRAAAEEDEGAEAGDPHADLVDALLDAVPVDPAERTDDAQGRALMAAALQYHDRERRPPWWQLFELIKAERDELGRATGVLVADDVDAGEWGMTGRQRKERRSLRLSSNSVDARDVFDTGDDVFLLYDLAPEGARSPADSTRGYQRAKVTAADIDGVDVEEMCGHDGATWPDLPIAVLPGPPIPTKPISDAIAQAASSAQVSGGFDFPQAAWADLLLSREPRHSIDFPRTGDETQDIAHALLDMDDSYVAVQGPPGTGKTYVGSRAVASLAEQGWRIGVVAQSHSVVDNFLEAVHKTDPSVALAKEPGKNHGTLDAWHLTGRQTVQDWAAGRQGYVIGGTAWTFSRGGVRDLGLDLLVIDEAGQFALPNAIACALTAKRVLLLGDPQQLPQVSQAAHPEGIETSVLAHVTGDVPVLPASRGYFLERTYRMHPELARPVSRLQYEGKLHAAPVTSMRSLAGVDPGIIPIAIDHEANTTSSTEEADAVVELVQGLIGRQWTGARDDALQVPRAMDQEDVIVVAAYNNQVRLIRRRLADAGLGSVMVGTVDKFQGRENVVVVVSMATSSAEDLPRGIDFLLSPNRLNVAISRAQWACYLVSSPALIELAPPSVLGMERLGGFLELVAR